MEKQYIVYASTRRRHKLMRIWSLVTAVTELRSRSARVSGHASKYGEPNFSTSTLKSSSSFSPCGSLRGFACKWMPSW